MLHPKVALMSPCQEILVSDGLKHCPVSVDVVGEVTKLHGHRYVVPSMPSELPHIWEDDARAEWLKHDVDFKSCLESGNIDCAWQLFSRVFATLLSLPCCDHMPGDIPSVVPCSLSSGPSGMYGKISKDRVQSLRWMRRFSTYIQGGMVHVSLCATLCNTVSEVLDALPYLNRNSVCAVLQSGDIGRAQSLCTEIKEALDKQCRAEVTAKGREWKKRFAEWWQRKRRAVYAWFRPYHAPAPWVLESSGVIHFGPDAVFEALRTYWLGVHAHPTDQWEVIPDLPSTAVPEGSALSLGADSDQDILLLHRCVRTLSEHSAAGPDGWQTAAWRRMDLHTCYRLAWLYEAIAHWGQWPQAALEARVALLPKPDAVSHDSTLSHVVAMELQEAC
eukprot:6484960-Amphidinium_carterae.1